MKKHIKTPTHIVAKRRQGFRRKMATRGGRACIARRRQKGRHKISI